MNRRTLKKHCRRAAAELVAKYGYPFECFTPAVGDETVDAPQNMEARHSEHGFMSPLRGTLLIWRRTSYEYDEWDCTLPTYELSSIKAGEAAYRDACGEGDE